MDITPTEEKTPDTPPVKHESKGFTDQPVVNTASREEVKKQIVHRKKHLGIIRERELI